MALPGPLPLAAALFVAWCGVTGPAAAQAAVSAKFVDSHAVLPPGAAPKQSYSRYYLFGVVRSADDLPFTTIGPVNLHHPRAVWMAVFARFRGPGHGHLQVVTNTAAMPQVVHGGCLAVNLVADAKTGVTLASWCNISEGPPVNGMPPRLPEYHRKGSPFR